MELKDINSVQDLLNAQDDTTRAVDAARFIADMTPGQTKSLVDILLTGLITYHKSVIQQLIDTGGQELDVSRWSYDLALLNAAHFSLNSVEV